MSRRPRGTPDQAITDIKAAITRLAKARPQRTTGKLTATNLAAEAGMSRKQLYHYFDHEPALAAAWRHLIQTRATSRPDDPEAEDRQRIRQFETELKTWKRLAAVARADADRQAQVNDLLRAENDRLRAANAAAGGRVIPISPD